MTTISTYEQTPIVFGDTGFKGPLTITTKGGIRPHLDPGATALYIPAHVANPTLDNAGFVLGASGYSSKYISYNGGIGIKVGAAAKMTNTGVIGGGYGGFSYGTVTGNGGVGVYIFAENATLDNAGEIFGGDGGTGSDTIRTGGAGVAVYAKSDVINTGTIDGGRGSQGYTNGTCGVGADGVLLTNDAKITNDGTVSGGDGGFFFGTGTAGLGGIGIYLDNATAVNNGYIVGGQGGLEDGSGNGGSGGDGVLLRQGVFTNNGTVAGGAGYVGKGAISGSGGVGVELYGTLASGSNSKKGVIIGGAGGTENDTYVAGSPPNTYHIYSKTPGYGLPGLFVVEGASFNNAGLVTGGASGAASAYNQYRAQPSGRGAVVFIGTLVNSGTISGGVAGEFVYGAYGLLGYEKATLTNSGKIFGGAANYGGQPGGDGAGLRNESTLTNSGTITGGAGGYEYRSPGTGGIGLAIDYSSATNTGIIRGGTGGASLYTGGAGGVGVQIEVGAFTNKGRVIGGAGGVGQAGKGVGGVGVLLTADGSQPYLGVTFVNFGTVSGSGGQDAVLDKVNGTIVAESGAVFDGDVVATNEGNAFEVAGTSASAMAGFGTKITGFTTIDFAANAKWVISGDIAGLAAGQTINGFAVGDGIKITDAATQTGTVIVKKDGVVTIEVGAGSPITLDITNAKAGATNYKFANGKLTETATKSAMTFIAPAETPKAAAPPVWTPTYSMPAQFYGFASSALGLSQAHVTAAIDFGVHDLALTQHRGVESMVTLKAG